VLQEELENTKGLSDCLMANSASCETNGALRGMEKDVKFKKRANGEISERV